MLLQSFLAKFPVSSVPFLRNSCVLLVSLLVAVFFFVYLFPCCYISYDPLFSGTFWEDYPFVGNPNLQEKQQQ